MITVSNLGPISEASVPTNSTVTAPSQSGKTTLVDAVCYAIVGTDAHGKAVGGDRRHQSEGAEEPAKAAEVSFDSPRGKISRRITASSKRADIDGAKTDSRGVAQWLGLTGKTTMARLVLAPLAWTNLYDKERGRPLRKALMSVLPPVDMGAEVNAILEEEGVSMFKFDAVSIKPALEQQTITNRREAVAEGRVEQAKTALAAHPAPGAPDGDAAEAQLVLAADAAHAKWASDMVTHTAHVAHLEEQHAAAVALYEAQADAVARWEQECGRIREQYAINTLAYQSAIQAYNTAAAAAKQWDTDVAALGPQPTLPTVSNVPMWCHEAKAKVGFAERQLLDVNTSYIEARDGDHTCPHCKQVWADGGTPEVERLTPLVRAAEKALIDAQAKAEEAKALIDAQAKAVVAHEQAVALRHQWGESKLTLGSQPRVPFAPREPGAATLPDKPQAATQPVFFVLSAPPAQPPEVTPEALAAAKATIQAHVDHATHLSTHNEAVARLEAEVAQAQAALEKETEEAARVRSLVAAVRAAPSRVAERQAAYLGDLGPVTLEWGATDKEQAVEVLIDGRPWQRASAGRLRYSDLYLRRALRRAADLGWLPLFVDQAQDWSGEWPEVENAVFLRTAPGEWSVESRARGAA